MRSMTWLIEALNRAALRYHTLSLKSSGHPWGDASERTERKAEGSSRADSLVPAELNKAQPKKQIGLRGSESGSSAWAVYIANL